MTRRERELEREVKRLREALEHVRDYGITRPLFDDATFPISDMRRIARHALGETVMLIIYQRKQRLERVFDSLDEALWHAAIGQAHEEFAPDEIRDGERIIRDDELDALVAEREREYERLWSAPRP